MNNVVVSIVTSTYNRSSVLKRAIESVVNQRFSQWEMCVVGDCTPDDSEVVVESFDDERITFYNLPEKSPSGAHGAIAKNYAIQHMAKGKYIAYLDDDDVYEPSYLAIMMGHALTHVSEEVLYCRSRYRDAETGRVVWGNPFQRWLHGYSHEKLRRFNFLNTNAVIHKKELIDRVGGWNPNTFFDDYDLWLRMSEVADFVYINKALVTTYIRDEDPFLVRAWRKGVKMLISGGKHMPLPYEGDYADALRNDEEVGSQTPEVSSRKSDDQSS